MIKCRNIGSWALAMFCLLALIACGGSDVSPVVYDSKGGEQIRVSMTASIDKEILAPFIRAKSYDSLEDARSKDKTKMDGLILGLIAFNLLVDYQDTRNPEYLTTAKEYLDYLLDGYPTTFSNDRLITWKYNYDWGDLSAGWWSCMDNAINALAFKAGSETFNDPRYEEVYRKALNGLLSTVQEGGSAIWIGQNSFWLSEYTWSGANLGNEYFVLNGYTFSLLALRVVASVTGDTYYSSMYDYALNSYKGMSDQFYAYGGDWTYYMLNPKEIEPMHYAIFDAVLLEALQKISNDPFFGNEVAKRRQIISKAYPLHIDTSGNFLFSVMGPPWPYWIDTYVVRIDFMDDSRVLTHSSSYSGFDYQIPPKDRFFIKGAVPQGATRAVLWSEYKGQAFKLYEVRLSDIPRADPVQPVQVGFTLNCAYDAVCRDQTTLTIDSSVVSVPGEEHYTNTQGRIMLTLAEPIKRSANKYFSINIAPQQNVNSLEIMLFDDRGNVATQYYIPLKGATNNILILSWYGFSGIDLLTDNIKEIQIKVHTSDESPYDIKVNGIVRLLTNQEVKEYLDSTEGYIPEKEKRI